MEDFEKKNNIYVPIHCHTEHSLLDGLSRPAELAHRAKEIGAPACAITDHGAMSGCLQFYKACRKEGITPILGMEAYMTPYGHSLSERVPYDQKELRNTPGKGHNRNNYHAILLCKDYTGYKNLCALHTASYAAGYYYKPRIDFELLKEHHEGLIFSNACVLGEVNHHLLHEDYDMARDHALRLQDLFGEDYYFEIMNHGLDMEIAIMPRIRELAKELGIKVIATNDSHFTYKEDHKLQRTMMLLGMHKSWADSDVAGSFFDDVDVTGQKNISGEDGDSDPIFSMPASLYVKDYDEMMEALCLSEADIPFAQEELANTLEIAEKCNCELPIIDPNDMSQYHTPLYAINKDLQFEDYEKSDFELRDSTVAAVLEAMHAAGKEGDTLQEVLTTHEYDSLLFLMWMCEKGIEERIKPKIEARGEPLPIEFYMKNPPKGFAVAHKHNSPDESFIKGNLADGKTPEDIIQMYRDRLDYEVSIVCRKGFLDYFSIVQQYCNHARFHDNPPGPGRGCLTDDNLVWTEGGVAKPISDVKIGDVVFDEKGVPSQVLNTYEYDVDEELRKITVYNSDDLILTSDHKVKVSPCIMHTKQYDKDKTYDDLVPQTEPIWIPASEIKQGDWVYIPVQNRSNTGVITYDLSDFIPDNIKDRCCIGKDYISYVHYSNQYSDRNTPTQREVHRKTGLSRHAINNFLFNKVQTSNNTIEKLNCYLADLGLDAETWKERYSQGNEILLPRYIEMDEHLAYLIGYYISDGWTHRGAVCFAFHAKDKIYQAQIAAAFKETFGMEISFVKRFEDKQLIEGICQDSVISSFFKSIIPWTVENKQIPKALLSVSDVVMKSLIRGLIDGDGSVSLKERRASYDTISETLAYQVKYILNTFGIPTRIAKRSYTDHPQWKTSYKVRISTNQVFGELYGLYPRKNAVLSVEKDGFICMRVKKNEPYRHVGKVYDLMIDTKNEPSYVTTSCVVHNSGAGALLNYLLGITSVDPLPNKLIFERFLNPDRVGYPDIDVDFNKAYRDEILKPYLREEYGEDNAAGVSTFTYAWGKAAIKAAARVLFNPPESVQWADDLCKLIDDHPKLDLNSELQDEGGNEALKQLIGTGRHYQQIIDLALMLQGRIIGTSIHASAFILSPFKITDKMPLTVPKAERERVQATGESVVDFLISYDGVETQESLGFVKLDLLCIKDLEVLSLTMQIIERVYGCKIDIESIPMDDAAVFQMLEDHLVSGLFQLDGSSGMAQVMDDVTPQSIEEINAVVALFRPGPMDYIPTYVSGKWHPETVAYLDPRLEPILKDTYGVCIAEGTSISTIDGNKNIEEMSVGDLVLTKEGNYSKCIDVIDNGYKECVNIRFDRGEGLTCTPDHKLFTQRGWVEAKNLTTSDIVKFFNEFESKEIEEFDPRQWLLGLYLADGHSTGSSIDIACESEEFAVQVKEIAEQAFPSMEHVHIKKRNHICASGKEATTWYVVFAQKEGNNGFFSDDYIPNEFVNFLREHDLLGKTKDNKFWPNDYSFSTLLGFVEGDGCYANRTISQKNRHLLYGVYQALNEYGIPANFYRRDDDLCWNVSFAYKDVLRPRIWLSRYEDPANRPSMFDESRCYGGFIPSAQLNRAEYLSAMNRADIKKIDNQDKVTLTFAKKYDYPQFAEHTEWARVKTVKIVGEKHVYDLTIEKEHSFVANKYTVHNCAYQEQAMQITQVIGGFTGGQADNYRKQAAKKHMDQLVLIKDDFIKGALENDTAPEVADALWEQLVKFGSYAFNRSHSAAYAYIAYRGGFLKAHFPECFLAAMCTIKPMMKKTLKVPAYLEEARQMGVQVKPPHVNYSMEDFDVPEKGVIAFGLGGIKRVGKGAAPIIAEREKNGPYKDFTDFCTRVPKEVGKAPIEALIKAGALDGLGWSRMAMEESIDQIVSFRKDYFREKSKRDLFEDDLFGFGDEASSDDSTAASDITLVAPYDTEYSELVLMHKERDEFGLYFDKDPRDFCQVSRFMLERELREHSEESRKSGNYDAPMFVNVKDVAELPDKTHVGFIANVEDFKEFNTKKGKRMASMYVWDNGVAEESRFGFAPAKAKVKCTIFSSVLATIAKPMPDDVVYITGRVSVDSEGKWPTAVLVDTIDLVAPDSQWLGSGASIEKMQEFATAQSDMRAYNEEVSNPASKRYMIPAISFPTSDALHDFCEDLRINKLYLKDGNVQVSAEDDPDGANTKILHLKQTMGTVKLAAEYGGLAKKIRHPKAARALARKAMLEGKTVDEVEAEVAAAQAQS